MSRVVVTGQGLVSPVGVGTQNAWQALLAGRTGVRTISTFDTDNLPVKIAAPVRDFTADHVLDAKERKRTTRFCQFALVAADEAVKHAGLDYENQDTRRWGVSIGVGLGALNDIEDSTLTLHNDSPRRVSPFFIPYAIPNMAAGVVSKQFNMKGPNICPTTACSERNPRGGRGFSLYQTRDR